MIKIIIDEDYVNFIEIMFENIKLNITYWRRGRFLMTPALALECEYRKIIQL
jgi:hypothetical protein